jgi:hypothetical protein
MPAPTSLEDIKLNEMRWNTQEFIKRDPTVVTLIPTRGAPIAKPGGGHDFGTPVPKPEQVFRLISQSNFDGVELSPNDDGTSRKFGYLVVGAYDADISIGDTWDEGDRHYHIDSISVYNGYEVRATATAFASDPIHG